MVKVGKSKFDRNGRVSLIKDIADLMDLMDGDYIEYYIEGGEIIIRKLTKVYPGGFDLEKEEIRQRVAAYEESHGSDISGKNGDPESALQSAMDQYKKDQDARRALKK